MSRPSPGAAFATAVLAIALVAPSAAGAAGALSTPSFVRSWESQPAGTFGTQLAVDPTGDVLLLAKADGGSSLVFRWTADGTPVSALLVPRVGPAAGLATDAVGHIYIAGYGALRMYTSSGGLLATFPLSRPMQGKMASDPNGHLFLTESVLTTQVPGGDPVINEYGLDTGEPVLLHTAAFPGTAADGYSPPGFFDVAVDSAGNVYGNGVSTTNQFIARFPPGLAGPTDFIDSCSGAACSVGFGLAIANSRFSSGDEEALYVAGGRTSGTPPTDGTQVDTITPPISGRETFGPQPGPGGGFASAVDVAASPCHASVYTLSNIFGGPGSTFSGNRIEQYDTHVPPTACGTLPVAVIGGLNKSLYRLRPIKGAVGPCTPCAALLPTGEFAERAVGAESQPGAHQPNPKQGAKLKFDASVAGDLTFTIRGPLDGHTRRQGGFVYAAHLGANAPRFSGVMRRKHHPLDPGIYRVGVKTIDGATVERFKIQMAETG
jgi:hypothetical protein